MPDGYGYGDRLYVCRDGHVTQAGGWDVEHAEATGRALPYDYTLYCRRNVWRDSPGKATVQVNGVEISSPMKAYSTHRCALPVVCLRKYPAATAALMLHGEDTVLPVVLGMADQEDRVWLASAPIDETKAGASSSS